jgi:hypothetical protein
MTDCEHSDDAATCPVCQRGGAPAIPPPAAHEVGPPFDASFPGHCRGCGYPIHPGDRIRAYDDHYRHADKVCITG